MANQAGGSGERPPRTPEQERDIAERRDALLAQSKGARGGSDLLGGADPRLLGLGLQFVVAILVCLYAGMWADGKLHTAPWLMLAGALVGGAAGFYSMFRVLMSVDAKLDSEEKRADRGGE